jgi:hypothetical protein
MTITTAKQTAVAFHPLTDHLTERITMTFSSRLKTYRSYLKALPAIVDATGCRKTVAPEINR